MGLINSKKFLIGGHRGSPKKKKENTLESFEQAIIDEADFIEFDIRSTSDGKLIIHHDASTEGFKISETPYSSLISASYKIPTLTDLLEFCKGKIMLDAEIKEPEITQKAVKKILEFYSPDKFIVTSFFDEAIRTVKTKFPNVTAGLLFAQDTTQDIEKRVKDLQPDLLLPHYSIFNKYQKLYEESGLKTILWTVNDDEDITTFMKDEKVLGIISDYPDKAVTYSS